jgi:hypothetical protein
MTCMPWLPKGQDVMNTQPTPWSIATLLELAAHKYINLHNKHPRGEIASDGNYKK